MLDESSVNNPSQPKGWGVISGSIWAVVAFLGPRVVVEPLVPLITRLGFSNNAELFILQALVELVVFGIIFAVIKAYGLSLPSIGLTKKIKPNCVLYALVAFPLYLLAANITLLILSKIFTGIDLTAEQQIGFAEPQNGLELLLVFVALVIIPPVVEEVVFRGFLFKPYRKRFGFWLASIFVSLLFALAHTPVTVCIDVFVLSMFLCYLREKTDSLWAPIFLHATKNFVAFIYLFIIGVN